MRTRLSVLLLSSSFALTGCELIARFDPALLDGGADVTADRAPVDATDNTPPSDVQDDTQDVTDTGPADAMDVTMEDVTDVTPPMDVVDVPTDVPTDVPVDVPVDVIVDTGVDAGDTGVDVPVDVPVDAALDVTDAGSDATADTGVDVPLLPFNGCTYATAVDLTADTTPTITFPGTGLTYDPACVRIHAGQTVTFSGSFASHPLRPGDATTRTTQPGTPITNVDTGTSAIFTFNTPGTWGYYCEFHAPGMAGTVYVDP